MKLFKEVFGLGALGEEAAYGVMVLIDYRVHTIIIAGVMMFIV